MLSLNFFYFSFVFSCCWGNMLVTCILYTTQTSLKLQISVPHQLGLRFLLHSLSFWPPAQLYCGETASFKGLVAPFDFDNAEGIN